MARFYALGEADDQAIFIGSDYTFRVQLVQFNSSGEDAVEGDVSSNAYSFTIREAKGDDTAIVTLTTAGGAITFGSGDTSAWSPVLGEVELAGSNTVAIVALADTDTDGLEARTYVWDMKRTDGGSEVVVAHGTIKLTEGVA